MKIWGDNPRVFGVYNQNSPVGKVAKPEKTASKRDKYEISGPAKDYQIAVKALKNIPDIRQDRVQEISAKMETNQYKVDAREISEKIIRKLSGKED